MRGWKTESLGLMFMLPCLIVGTGLRAAEEKPSSEPAVTSMFPMGGRQGAVVQANIRGTELEGAYALWLDTDGVKGEIGKVETTQSETKTEKACLFCTPRKAQPIFAVEIRLKISPTQRTGSYNLRLITPRGISNPVRFEVNREPTIVAGDAPHQTASEPEPVRYPVAVNGRIDQSGELDAYSFEVGQRQRLKFEVMTNEAKAATGPGVPPEFQPRLDLYEAGGSWLNPLQSNWLASGAQDAPLTYRFEKGGRYVVKVGSILGKGVPDYVYQLRIVPSEEGISAEERKPSGLSQPTTLEGAATRPGWQERSFTRVITPVWSEVLCLRTVQEQPVDTIASVPAGTAQTSTQATQDLAGASAHVAVPALVKEVKETEPNDALTQAALIPIPALINGMIDRPGDVDTFKFNVKAGQRLAFEIQTPDAAPPRFNPRLAILNSEGSEILNNIRKRLYTLRREAPSMTVPAFLDGIQPKVIVTFADPGGYYLQIRGLTYRTGDAHCSYRVLIRDQVSHIGNASLAEDHVNLSPGEAKTLTVTADLEEGFDGELALAVDSLPQGVRAYPGVEAAIAQPDGYETYNKESLDPQTRKVTLILSAEPGAAITQRAYLVRVEGRPIVKGKLGREFIIGEIPLMVVNPPPAKPLESAAGGKAQ